MSKLEQQLLKAELNLKKINTKLDSIEKKQNLFETSQETLTKIVEVIKGLEITKTACETEEHCDPGKYRTAYFFVESMGDEDIDYSANFEPSLMYKCPKCSTEVPILMSYRQTRDSDEGDTWTKKAFIICCDKIVELKKINNEYRFL